MKPLSVKVENLSKEFYSLARGRIPALENINLEIGGGEFFVILGPSGCGKSTLLNILAGLDKPTRGDVFFSNSLVFSTEKRIFLGPKQRNVAMVFQSYALYPHMTVFENIAFPLKILKMRKNEIKKNVIEAAKMLDIFHLLYVKPKELSGGQRQRVAIARAIVRHPSIFLLDEPLSNLDAQLRVRMRSELKNLQRRLNVTTIYVTHDQIEAMTLGDRIAILKDGNIQQIGAPLEVYDRPINTFVAGFLGTPPMNLINANLYSKGGKLFVQIGDIKIKLDWKKWGKLIDLKEKECIVGIRPENIGVSSKIEENKVRIALIEQLGNEALLYFQIENQVIISKPSGNRQFKEGEIVNLLIDKDKIHIFKKNGSRIGGNE